ncbi:MAG TPA: hypothetical protein VF263_26225, partial [Longimicrobiaceae bacterium]
MSLRGFQQALADLVASPELCRAARADTASVLGRYELTPREERRLADVVRQRGMATSCALFRGNRLGPVYALLPLTCFLLGPRLAGELERFWAVHPRAGDANDRELGAFAEQLRARLASGELEDEVLGEVLEYEMASFALGLLPAVEAGAGAEPGAGGARLDPRVRVVRFRHDPAALLGMLGERQPPPYELEEGEFYLLLDARGEARRVGRIAPRLGRLLAAVEADGEDARAPGEREALVGAGLALSRGPPLPAPLRPRPPRRRLRLEPPPAGGLPPPCDGPCPCDWERRPSPAC